MKCRNKDCGAILINPKECGVCGWTPTTKSDSGNTIPPYSKVCGVDGCENDTAVNFVFIKSSDGDPFPVRDSRKYFFERNGVYSLVGGYEFVMHISRCNDCYLRELGGHSTMNRIRDDMKLKFEEKHGALKVTTRPLPYNKMMEHSA